MKHTEEKRREARVQNIYFVIFEKKNTIINEHPVTDLLPPYVSQSVFQFVTESASISHRGWGETIDYLVHT